MQVVSQGEHSGVAADHLGSRKGRRRNCVDYQQKKGASRSEGSGEGCKFVPRPKRITSLDFECNADEREEIECDHGPKCRRDNVKKNSGVSWGNG